MESSRTGTCLTAEELTILAGGVDDPNGPAAAHLASCATCSDRLRELRQTVALAQPPEVGDPGEDFNRAVWGKIERRRAQQRVQRVRVSVAATLAAAATALVVLLPRGAPAPDEAELVENLDLYQYVDLIENLDAVEALDALLEEGPLEG